MITQGMPKSQLFRDGAKTAGGESYKPMTITGSQGARVTAIPSVLGWDQHKGLYGQSCKSCPDAKSERPAVEQTPAPMLSSMDDKPPSSEDSRNWSQFFRFTRKYLCGLCFWGEEIKTLPIAGGVGVYGLRHPILIPLLGTDGEVKV